MGISIEEVKEYEKSFERSLDDTGINFITLRDYVNAKYIPKDQYEARLKADMVAMLTDLQLEIEEHLEDNYSKLDEIQGVLRAGRVMENGDCSRIIQQKINVLKENKDE